MASLPVQVLFGIYLGILTGIIPAIIAWTLGFTFKYLTGVTVPGFAVVVLGVAIAGINGGLLALNDPTITSAPNSVTLIVALLVVLMLSFYAHGKGDIMGATFPKRLSLRAIGARTLSADVVEHFGGRGQVRIRVAGDVGDVEGYPPLPADLRAELSAGEWRFPADLPIAGLETRLSDTLRTEYDLAAVSVRIDERGRASIDAAPPERGVSKRVPRGKRAVSVETLLPTGLARGDVVTVRLPDTTLEGTVVSAKSEGAKSADLPAVPDGGSPEPRVRARAPTTDGGPGRITLAVDREAADRLLHVDRVPILVRSRGTRREFQLLSVLRRAGKQVQRATVGETGALVGSTIGEADLRDQYGVVVLAIQREDDWSIAPSGRTRFEPGDALLVLGDRPDLEAFTEVIA